MVLASGAASAEDAPVSKGPKSEYPAVTAQALLDLIRDMLITSVSDGIGVFPNQFTVCPTPSICMAVG